MPIYDVSVSISSSLPVWPGDHSPVQIEPLSRIADGAEANVSRLILGTHTGTHVDPPGHFVHGGATVDEIDLELLIGPAVVVDLRGRGVIGVSDLESTVPWGAKRLLLKTDNSRLWSEAGEFASNYVALTPAAADWLVARDVGLVGTDYLSVQGYHDPHPGVHTTLLSAGVVIVEGLNLLDVPPGLYQFICLPLKVEQGDGAPARAVLVG